LATVWFWDVNDCNLYADRNDPENLRKVINDGLNGYADVLGYYDRAALVLLGYGVNELVQFQKDAKIDYKTGSGPITRGELHKALVDLTAKPEQSKAIQAAPVVEVKEVPVKLENPEKPWYQLREVVVPILTGGGITGAGTLVEKFGGIPWQNLIIIVVAGAAVGLCLFIIISLLWISTHDAMRCEGTIR
jgi:putative chitinase